MWQECVVAISLVFLGAWFVNAQELTYTQDSLNTIKQKVEAGEAILLDVREQDEWDAGHAKLAVLMPMSTLRDKKQRAKSLEALDKNKPIYCHCKVGGRAMVFAEMVKGTQLDVRPMKYRYKEIANCGLEIESK